MGYRKDTMDQKTVWYGSINLLSYGSAQESIMRLKSSNIANKLISLINPSDLSGRKRMFYYR